MKTYSPIISLTKNSRGVYSLDPTMGCSSGMKENKRGCFNDCYAFRISRIYGYDFSQTVERFFKSQSHIEKIKKEINKVKLPFIRMGTMGDPSENWEHTINVCELIQNEFQYSLFPEKLKEIVIITKHWKNLNINQLERLKKLNICINTSVSALENKESLDNSLKQFEILKNYCKSILRVVTFDFNIYNEQGNEYNKIQNEIINKYNFLDTVFRSSKNNELVTKGIINIHETKFLKKKSYISKMNKKTYFGSCNNCIEMCGVNM